MTADYQSAWIDHIPAIWLEPSQPQQTRRLAIFLNGLSGTKEGMLPYLTDLAQAGFVALTFDEWEHGERGSLPGEQILQRTFGNFRRHMWVNIAQSALDALRVIDWAIANLGVEPEIVMGGLSMGGDISVTAAGLDPRIRRVAAVVATPDWLRPGMMDLINPNHPLLPPGTPDAYSRTLYELFNPITHLSRYAHAPEIHFVNGAEDDHVPPEASYRFKNALTELYPQAGENVTIELIPGADHAGAFRMKEQWWPGLLKWMAGER